MKVRPSTSPAVIIACLGDDQSVTRSTSSRLVDTGTCVRGLPLSSSKTPYTSRKAPLTA